ncbi:hypothetical protein [Streptomyces sp. NPDC002845]
MTEPAPVKVVIADDHPMFLFGFRAALASSDELAVVGRPPPGRNCWPSPTAPHPT